MASKIVKNQKNTYSEEITSVLIKTACTLHKDKGANFAANYLRTEFAIEVSPEDINHFFVTEDYELEARRHFQMLQLGKTIPI